MLKSKKGVFDRLSDAAFWVKRPESKKSSHDSLLGSCAVIDANFVELNEDSSPDSGNKSKSGAVPNSESIPNSNSFDPELLDKLREYLKTRSQEEISEIFEEIRKILENRASKGKSESEFSNIMGEVPYNERRNIRENIRSIFRFCSETASRGKKRIISVSKVVSSAASSIASDGKESIKVSSRELNKKWNELSPSDRKIISELIIAVIEIGLLKGSSKSRKAAFAILSSITRHQTPGRNDLEQFLEGAQKVFKRKN
ncbi:MAG: hypothetical protein QG646_997 [Euryarchaeota archaeon]|nr:hypothetical protein [Euryarchaeota archaeon]